MITDNYKSEIYTRLDKPQKDGCHNTQTHKYTHTHTHHMLSQYARPPDSLDA